VTGHGQWSNTLTSVKHRAGWYGRGDRPGSTIGWKQSMTSSTTDALSAGAISSRWAAASPSRRGRPWGGWSNSALAMVHSAQLATRWPPRMRRSHVDRAGAARGCEGSVAVEEPSGSSHPPPVGALWPSRP
jgi:hypothetical protein